MLSVRQIYIARHGATRLNEEAGISVDRERGWSDVPLAPEGREQALKAALKLKDKGIDAIVSSDLNRAKETALIIGHVLGIQPEFSFELRPWNLGHLTGVEMKEATPQIAAYACKTPDKKVPKGESFDEFNTRAFGGVADALANHPGETVLIVAHHRIERLLEAWDKEGQPPEHTINLRSFMAKGDPPGGIKILRTTETALRGDYFSHDDVRYERSAQRDRCSTCKAYRGRNDCRKGVIPPIEDDGWCRLGNGKRDGHPFDRQVDLGSKDDGNAETVFHPSQIGARQASDGEYYLPDPTRPGKHMMVVF